MGKNRGDRIFHAINAIIMIALVAVFILPFWLVFSGSVTGESYLQTQGVTFAIHGFNLDGFRLLFSANDKFLRSMIFTLAISFFSAFLVTFTAGICAYALSKKYLVGRKVFNWLIWTTGVFNGGMIPTYLLYRTLGWYDTVWVLILPLVANSYNILLLRNYFYSLPTTLEESASLDGANDWQIMRKIFMPLSYPMLFTIALMTFVGRWNGWMDALLPLPKQTHWSRRHKSRFSRPWDDPLTVHPIVDSFRRLLCPKGALQLRRLPKGPFLFLFS